MKAKILILILCGLAGCSKGLLEKPALSKDQFHQKFLSTLSTNIVTDFKYEYHDRSGGYAGICLIKSQGSLTNWIASNEWTKTYSDKEFIKTYYKNRVNTFIKNGDDRAIYSQYTDSISTVYMFKTNGVYRDCFFVNDNLVIFCVLGD